jgi:hypothetical protein
VALNVNPLEYFEVGRAGGAVKSPAYGPNMMVSGLLKQLENIGVVSAQAGAQGQQARQTALYKEQITTPLGAGRPAPKVTEEEGVFKVPEFDAQGRWTGGYKYHTKPAGLFNIFDTEGGEAPTTGELSPQEELQILKKLIEQRNNMRKAP